MQVFFKNCIEFFKYSHTKDTIPLSLKFSYFMPSDFCCQGVLQKTRISLAIEVFLQGGMEAKREGRVVPFKWRRNNKHTIFLKKKGDGNMSIPKKPENLPIDFGADPEGYLEEVTESGDLVPLPDSWLAPEILRKKADRTIEVNDFSEIF